ncbi:hypothetical protein KPL70_025965 [Citrus sinensis]|nr:hypothetical protein KPL70_025965 [Citrus sinensis]
MDQYHYHIVQTQSSDSSDSSEPETTHSSSSSSYVSSKASTDSESEYADITGILMAIETTDPSAYTSTPIVNDNPSDQASQTQPIPPPVHEHSTKPSLASWFTFDDIPRHKWAARLQEFVAWIDLQGTKPNAQPQVVLCEFMARSTGSLRDWLESLGEYRQLQFMESSIGTALNIIHEQFIGEKTASTEADRKEYHQMKCCSLKRHLLDAHYKRMSILFYKLNGFNEPSLKHVFIASLPSELQPDLQRKLTATNLSIADISLGKIFQMAMLSLDKICEQKEFFKDLMEDKKPFSEASKAVRLIQHLQQSSLLSENEDVESNFSEQSAQDDQTAFLIAESSDFEDISIISTVQTVNHVSTIPRPSLKMSILPSKFHKPVPVIGFIDTGVDTSMIDPSVLPSDCWERHSKLFRAVNGETFETTLITKKPIVAIHTSQLSRMLKKQCLPWGPAQTEAVKQLKVIAQSPPPLRIPTSGQRILQTDANDNYWSAILLEDINGVRHFCAQASGQFKDSKKNYHRTYPHPHTFIHDTSVTSVLKAYLMELNNVLPPATNIHHTSIGPSHTLEIIPKTHGCTPGSSSSPREILVMEQRLDYTNVLFQDAQDPWKDFQSLLPTDTPHYTVTNPDSPAASTSQHMSEADEEKYQQAEAYLDQRQRRRHKRQYKKETGDVSPSHYPSTP